MRRLPTPMVLSPAALRELWSVSFGVALPALLLAMLGSAHAAPTPTEHHPGEFPANQWVLSASPTDPWVQTAPPAGGERTLYLWLTAADGSFQSGVFQLYSSGGIQLPGVITPLNGTSAYIGTVWAAGRVYGVDLPTCQEGPFLAAAITTTDNGGRVCFALSHATCTTQCGVSHPEWSPSFIGFASDGSAPCRLDFFEDALCLPYPAVDDVSWGQVKARYE